MSFITVYIPTYNREFMLERALKSVLNQTYKNFEIIVVDDCSTDGTIALLENFAKKFKLFRFYQNAINSGACTSRNKAIEEAKGEYITGLDDDDEFEPTRLQYLMENFDPKYSFITTGSRVLDFNGSKNINCSTVVFSYNDLFFENIAGNQFFTKTERLRKVGGYDVKLKSAQDLDIMVRLCFNFGIAKRFWHPLYIIHIEHESPRISTSSDKISGMQSFFLKHYDKLTLRQKLFNFLLIHYWRSKPKKSYHIVVIMLLLRPSRFITKLKNI